MTTLMGLHDRALIAAMIYTFARVSAVVGFAVGDHYQVGRRCWLRLKEKGGRFHEVPLHHKAEEFLDAYPAAAGIGAERLGGPLVSLPVQVRGADRVTLVPVPANRLGLR